MRVRKIALTMAASTLAVSASVVATGSMAEASGSGGISVLYSNNYVFNSDALATKWWNGIVFFCANPRMGSLVIATLALRSND